MLLNKHSTTLAIFHTSFTTSSICLKNAAPGGIVAYKFQDFFRARVNKEKKKQKIIFL